MDPHDVSRPNPRFVGRAARRGPPNRFETTHVEDDFEHLSSSDEVPQGRRSVSTEFLEDTTSTLISKNDSPDIPFRFSINPYRGCEHGCAYCYARPTHEYLGFDAALDFETKVLVKYRAAELLRNELSRSSWTGEPIAMSGVTDCYQPAERRFRLTRQCLEVMHEACQPTMIVTKNALIGRDIDLLAPMAAANLATVSVSLTTLDTALARSMEPRTSTPAARLRTISDMAAAGISVQVMIAPVIPGLNDREIPALLDAARAAGARAASYILLRLPLTVEPVFFSGFRITTHWPPSGLKPMFAARMEAARVLASSGSACAAKANTPSRLPVSSRSSVARRVSIGSFPASTPRNSNRHQTPRGSCGCFSGRAFREGPHPERYLVCVDVRIGGMKGCRSTSIDKGQQRFDSMVEFGFAINR